MDSTQPAPMANNPIRILRTVSSVSVLYALNEFSKSLVCTFKSANACRDFASSRFNSVKPAFNSSVAVSYSCNIAINSGSKSSAGRWTAAAKNITNNTYRISAPPEYQYDCKAD